MTYRTHYHLLIACACLVLWTTASVVRCQEVSELVLQAEQQRIDAIAKAVRSAVAVFGATSSQGGGSGVVISSDGYAITNFHVAQPSGPHMKCGMSDGKFYDAVIVGVDPTGDVALIKLLGRDDFPAAELADSDLLRVGDSCFTVGNPFLLATDFQPSVSWGMVSGVHRYQYPAGTLLEYADCIQTDAAINPGNSGGPLFDAQGRVIGINGRGSFEKRGRVNVGVGYAISINQVKHFIGYLRSGRIVDHATLGATVATNVDDRVTVNDLLESSDAFRRGLRYDDEIVSFAGRSIYTTNGFKNVLGIFPKGWRVPLSYRRDGERHDVIVRLEGVHTEEELIKKTQAGATPTPPQLPPGKDPGKKTPEDKQEKPSLPKRSPRSRAAKKLKLPDFIANLYESRKGYANYYFNKLNRDRVWDAFVQSGDFSKDKGSWELVGKLGDGKPFAMLLGEETVRATLGASGYQLDLEKDLDTQLVPDDSGGLLVAMHIWRRLLTMGPQQFGDLYYVGTAPLPDVDKDRQLEIFTGIFDVVETQFFFSPTTGYLVRLEMSTSADMDPCEIRLSDYRPVAGKSVPHRMEVRYGDTVFAVLNLESFVTSAKKDEA